MDWNDLLHGLTPVTAAAGFAEPQVGVGTGRAQAIFCTCWQDLRDRVPHLPQYDTDPTTATDVPPPRFRCLDLVVNRDAASRVSTVDLDRLSLQETLRRLGYAGLAADVDAVLPGPVPTAGPVVLRAVGTVLAPDERVTVEGGTARLLGAGSPVLVLPGGPLLDSHYLGDLGGLGAHRRLVVPDLPRERVFALVPLVQRVAAGLDDEPVDVLAHSAGTTLALALLVAHPERVRSLVLICPAVRAAGIGEDEAWVDRTRARVAASGVAPAEHAAAGHEREERLAAYHAPPTVEPDDVRRSAAAFTGPVTVLHGELDVFPSPGQAEALAGLFPHGRTRALAGSGHFPWLDGPAVATALRDAVLSGLSRSQPVTDR